MVLKFVLVKTSRIYVIDTEHFPPTWDIKHIIEKEWFCPKFINDDHVGRDGSIVGNSRKLIEWKIMSDKDLKEYAGEKNMISSSKSSPFTDPPESCLIGEIEV